MVCITICELNSANDLVNGRDKVICVNKLEANEVQKKVSLVFAEHVGNLHSQYRSISF